MARRLLVLLVVLVVPLGLAAAPALAAPGHGAHAAAKKAKKKKAKKLLVCHHGCPYRTIQSAVNAARAGQTVRIKPGQYNTMGAAFGDANGTDYWFDGSGKGNCVSNSSAGSTFDPGVLPVALLYPSCPAPGSGTGGSLGDALQDAELLDYTSKTTAEEDSWSKHPHPPRLDRKPIDGM